MAKRRPGFFFLLMDRILDIQPAHRFKLADRFLEPYASRQPDWGPLGEITFRRTYSRQKPDGSYEDWWETVRRVVDGTYTIQKWHCARTGLPWSDKKAQRSAQEMYELIFSMKFLPPGRGLWMMGTDYIEQNGGGALNNCAFASTAHIADGRVDNAFAEPFTFLMDFSMLGVGVGGDTKGAGKMTPIVPSGSASVYVVPDTREGWVEAVRLVLMSYVEGKPWLFDTSQIRPAGLPIKGFGGIAAGPAPLEDCIARLHSVLLPRAKAKQAITSSDIVDIFNIIGACVVSGNVRRSAEVLIGEPDDAEFLALKDPSINSERMSNWGWASNNSVFAEIGTDYKALAPQTAKNGEPGYIWMDTVRGYGRLKDARNDKDKRAAGSNPCLEQTLESYELCCLVETFPSRHASYEEYERTLKHAYLYAKTVTLVPTHFKKTNRVMMRNRRIGCSQSGIVESFKRHGRREHMNWCDKGYAYIQSLDVIYSEWLAIPRSIKMTSVKPSGTVSLLPGVTPGIHYEHAEYYYRTIRVASNSRLVPALRKAGYRIEVAKSDRNSVVVYFPVHARYFEKGKDDVTMWEQLENAAAMQYYWADNQVSVTVTFRPSEANDIQSALELYESRLKSVSFLPLIEHGYEQAPYQTITREEYERAASGLKRVDYSNTDHEVTDSYCDGDKCEIGPTTAVDNS